MGRRPGVAGGGSASSRTGLSSSFNTTSATWGTLCQVSAAASVVSQSANGSPVTTRRTASVALRSNTKRRGWRNSHFFMA
jgi:hypothetical protein